MTPLATIIRCLAAIMRSPHQSGEKAYNPIGVIYHSIAIIVTKVERVVEKDPIKAANSSPLILPTESPLVPSMSSI